MTAYWLEAALLGDAVVEGARVEHRDGVIVAVSEAPPAASDVVLPGLTLPGFANSHSHAFHRALRGRTHADGGDFWSWRRAMYAASAALDPESYERLATAVFSEMVLAGYTVVGEFHYLHHAPGGRWSADAGEYADAIVRAAGAAGIRLTLLDTLYLQGGRDAAGAALPLDQAQLRFGDRDVDEWMARHVLLRESPLVRRGAAIHSLRAVEPSAAAALVAAVPDEPLHAHVSEQPAENDQLAAAFGSTPIALLAAAGALSPRFTAVHATHLTDADIALLGSAGATACFCPTTERDLGDGIGPAGRLVEAGVRLAIGSDQHAITDPFQELQALEGHERLARLARGAFTPHDLLVAGTANGYRSLGWNGGTIAAGQLCDLVSVRTDSPRTAGALTEQLWLAASASDVTDVVVGGRRVVSRGHHDLGDVGAALSAAIREVMP